MNEYTIVGDRASYVTDPDLIELIIEQNNTIIEQNNELIKYLRTLNKRN